MVERCKIICLEYKVFKTMSNIAEQGVTVSGDGKDNTNNKKTQRRWKTCVYIQSALTLLLLIALLSLTVFWRQTRIKSLAPKQNKLSVPCANIQLNHKDDYGEFEVTLNKEKNETFCFGDVSDVLNRLVKKNVKQQFRDNYASRLFSSMDSTDCRHKTKKKSAASVFGLSLEHMHGGDVIHWNHKSPNSFHHGVHYHRGYLEIEQPGYYYVFSQIKLRSQPRDKVLPEVDSHSVVSDEYKTTDSNGEVAQRHYIHVTNQSSEKERKLLESSKSRCDISEGRETTSAIGAVFYLNANDKLFVRTSHPQHLVACNHTNHFGAYMV